jgi:hypothetical protein
MKTKTKFLFMSIVTIICFVFIGTVYSLDVSFTDILLNSISGVSYAAVAGAVTTQNIAAESSELLDNPLSQTITKMQPSKYPLDTIIRKVALHRKSRGWEPEWYAVDSRTTITTTAESVRASVDEGGDGVDSGSLADYGGDDTAPPQYTIKVASVSSINIDDNMMFDGIEDGGTNSTYVYLIGHVVAKNTSDVTLTFMMLTDDGLIPEDIASGTTLVRIGNAKLEVDAITTPFTVFPQKVSNYNQVHMNQVEETIYAQLHEKEVNWGMSDYKAQSLYDLRRSFESTSFFGKKKRLTIVDDYKYFSGGILNYIEQHYNYTAGTMGNAEIMGMTKKVFSGDAGSDKRFFFMGKDLVEEFGKSTMVSKQIDGGSTEVIFGITFNKIVTNFGVLLCMHHKLFDSVPGWTSKGVILDMTQIEKHVYTPMEVNQVDFRKTGVRKVKANILEETFCLGTRYPDTHMIVKTA